LTASDVLGTGWFAADAANVKPGGTVVVVGDGAVGLLAVLSAKQMGAERIIAMSRHDARHHLDSGFQKMNGGAVPPRVRKDTSQSAIRPAFDNLLGRASDDLVDSESSQSRIPWPGKDGLVWYGSWFEFGEQFFEKRSRFIPEGTEAPLVPFSVQMNVWAANCKNNRIASA
jgi:hypothetical protein